MKGKFMTALVALVLCLALVSCDEMVNIMGRMGENVLGADSKQVETAVESVKVSEESQTKKKEVTKAENEENAKVGETEVKSASTFTYKNGDEEVDLYSVGVSTNDNAVIGVAGKGVELKKTSDETKKALAAVETVLPPQDISLVTSALEGNGKAETLEKLKAPIEDEATKKAAEGTKTVITALLEEAKMDVKEDDDESTKKAKEVVNTILNNLKPTETKDEKGETKVETKDLTMGDLIVLQTITNVISESGKIVSLITGDVSGDTMTEVLDEANDSLITTATILNTVSETTTMFEGVDLSSLLSMVM